MTRDKSDLFESIESALDSIRQEQEQRVNSVTEFRSRAEELEEEYSELAETKQEQFRRAMVPVLKEVEETASYRDLLEKREAIEDAVRVPKVQATKETVHSVLNELNVDEDNISDDTWDKIERSIEADPDGTRSSYESILEDLENLNSTALNVVSSRVSEEQDLLSSPESLSNYTADVREDHEILSGIAERLGEVRWFPDDEVSFVESEVMYAEDYSQDSIRNQIDELERLSEGLFETRVPFDAVLQSEFEALSTDGEDGFEFHLEKLTSDLAFIDRNLEEIQTMDLVGQEVKSVKELEPPTFVDILDTINEEPPETVANLVERISKAVEEYQGWTDQLNDDWTRLSNVLNNYSERTEEDLPERVSENLEERLVPQGEPAESLRVYVEALEWKASHEDLLIEEGLSSEAVSLYEQVISDETVILSESDLEPLSELVQVFDIQVSIDE